MYTINAEYETGLVKKPDFPPVVFFTIHDSNSRHVINVNHYLLC